jgi:hypothetical protein
MFSDAVQRCHAMRFTYSPSSVRVMEISLFDIVYSLASPIQVRSLILVSVRLVLFIPSMIPIQHRLL